ncbi:glycosyltransferase family 4 protein [Candidatus Methylopumilus planktonicus]|uniref:glycosyltransferase family 4 protein n=1 Tax=Candidatus Methylopumilus planktonicus TaxID=1581557 RepID=UPI003D18FBAF
MRLLIVSQYFWPENFRINDLAAELQSRGYQITVLTGIPNYPEGKYFQEYLNNSKLFLKYKNIEIVRVPIIPRGSLKFNLALNYLSFAISSSLFGPFFLRRHKFDAIFVYGPSPITVAIPGIIFRSLRKIPLIFWVFDLWPETLQAVKVLRSKIIFYAVKRLVIFIYRKCDLILAPSRAFIPYIRKLAGKKTPIYYFPSWADHFGATRMRIPALEIKVHKGVFNIIFTGNIGEAQDFPTILAAAEMLKFRSDIRWFFLGNGRKVTWVKNQIKIKKLEESVILLGSFPVSRMPSFFLCADVLLVTLKKHRIFSATIPGKLQSYLAAGKPILGMLHGEGAKIVNESGAGITCTPGDAKKLANSVLKLAGMSREDLSVMGKNGLKYSNREFNRQKLLINIMDLISKTKIISCKK